MAQIGPKGRATFDGSGNIARAISFGPVEAQSAAAQDG